MSHTVTRRYHAQMTSEEFDRWFRERMVSEVVRQAAGLPGMEFSCGEHVPQYPDATAAPPVCSPSGALAEHRQFTGEDLAGEWHLLPGQHGPLALAAAAIPGDSHIWVTVPLPGSCEQVTIGSETHRLDQNMIRSQDGYGRYAVWLETTLRLPWPTGTEVTAG